MTGTSSSSSSSRSLKLAFAATVLVCCAARACGSAIPMWEFLTREEKMSHLYRIFSQEVDQYCSDSTMPDCNKNLLVTGLKNLAHIEDDKLDEMDPYQRGAKDIIWRAMVGNNRQTASRLGQHSFHTTADADPLAVGDNELPQESSANYDYAHPNDHHTGPYLMGPMVIRVYPDGRPVPSDAQRPLPKDEDIEDIRYSRLPTIKDLEAAKKNSVAATVVAAPTSASSAASDNKKTFSEPPRELLPPRQSIRSNFYRIGAPARFYSRIARPNNLLVRERYY